MSKANERAARLTLSDSHLDGYAGRVDIRYPRRRRWWERLLRRKCFVTESRYVDVRGDRARSWNIAASLERGRAEEADRDA